jgi:hypothetical protein
MGTATLDVPQLDQLPRRLRSKIKLVDAKIGPKVDRGDDDAHAALAAYNAEHGAFVDEGPVPTAHTAWGLDTSTREGLTELYRRLGFNPAADPMIRGMIDRGIRPVSGGSPVGVSGMGFQHNLPEPGTFVENSDAFFQNTERNDIPGRSADAAWPGLGGQGVDVRIPQVGLLSGIRILFTGTLTIAGAGTATATYQWPHNIFKRVALNVNGQTGIIGCEGSDLRARRQRSYRNPRDHITAAPATDAADLFTLAGGSTAALTGSIAWTYTIFDIPLGDTSNGRLVLLPSMEWLHGMLAYNSAYSNTGEVPVGLIRTAGQLLCLYVYMDSGGNAALDPIAASEIRLQYGGNRRPRVFNPPAMLVEKNSHDYNGRILRAMGYVLLDNEVDNPVRDLVYPKGVTELQFVVVIPTSVTLGANPRGHIVEETMFPGR